MNLVHHLQSLAAVILTFGMVIFLHESGHFILCRWLGVRVEKFAFGFGPELLGITGSTGTRFSICALPLGGFVKPAGEEPATCSGAPDEYFGQSWNRRLAIVAAGPAMNYLLAFTLFTGVVYVKGMPEATEAPVIGNMMTGFPADRAGLEIDDEITAVNGKPTKTWDELAGTIHKFPGKELTLSYRRKELTGTVKLVARKDDATGNGVIGIMPKASYKPVGFATAMKEGVHQCWALTKMTVSTIASKIYKRERPDLAGPVGIVQMVSRAAHSGWEDLIFLIGLISVAIGFFNILPVPLLDGGHAATYIWEGIAGRRPTKEAMTAANGVGIAFLFSLLIFATYNDLLRMRDERARAKPAPAPAVQTKSK
ncbi:MAG: site-2 protease family protein [Elusimicrobia bacterium]|nr:site-2 protease family protein [Elusimicrobiota bacterium]